MASSRPRRRGGGDLERVADNWERLVRAALKRGRGSSVASASVGGQGLAAAVPASLGRTTNIEQILQVADDIGDEDPNVARILCEQAYAMAQSLDPSSERRGVLQFKTGLQSVIKQKLAKKDGAPIDRQNVIPVLWNFYLEYKSRRRVDDMQREQERLRQSGTFSTEMGARAMEMKKVYVTLRALLDVLEFLVGQSPTDRLHRQILEEIKKIKRSDAALRGELIPYNIVPLDAPSSVANIIGFFPEAPKKDKAPLPPLQIDPDRSSPASRDVITTSRRMWRADEELALLKAVLVHKHTHKRLPSPENLDAMLRGRLRAEDSIDAKQVSSRLQTLRGRYYRAAIRLSRGTNTMKDDELAIYNFSKAIWAGTCKGKREKVSKACAADARQDPRGFDDLVGLYPCLAEEVDAIDDAAGVLKRAFGRIDDNMAEQLEAKAKKQQLKEVRASEKLGRLKMDVLKELLRLFK